MEMNLELLGKLVNELVVALQLTWCIFWIPLGELECHSKDKHMLMGILVFRTIDKGGLPRGLCGFNAWSAKRNLMFQLLP